MSARSIYFAKAPLRGPGKLHYLVTPQEAPAGSAPRALLGSLVEEIDSGLFSMKEVPGADHVWKREYIVSVMQHPPDLAGVNLIEQTNLASVSQELKVEKKFKLGVDAPVPGVPASASIGIDYTKIRKVVMTLGAGCAKYYIPEGFLKAGYDHAQSHSDQFDRQLFYDDYMGVSQILVVRKMKLTVESDSDFSAGFDAKADEITDLNLGVKYQKTSKRKYDIDLDDGKEYLFGVRGVQLDKLQG